MLKPLRTWRCGKIPPWTWLAWQRDRRSLRSSGNGQMGKWSATRGETVSERKKWNIGEMLVDESAPDEYLQVTSALRKIPSSLTLFSGICGGEFISHLECQQSSHRGLLLHRLERCDSHQEQKHRASGPMWVESLLPDLKHIEEVFISSFLAPVISNEVIAFYLHVGKWTSELYSLANPMAEKRTKEKMHQTISEVAKPTMGKTIRQYKTPSACVALSDLWPRVRQNPPLLTNVPRWK